MFPKLSQSQKTPTRTLSLAAYLAGSVLLALAIAAPLMAQQTGQVTGEVISATSRQPVIGAQVTIEGTGIGTLTNNVGRYLLLNVPVGTHTIHVQVLGYAPESREITVTAGSSTTADFQLATRAVALDEIVVTGTAGRTRQREVGVSLELIGEEEIARAAVVSMADVLQGRAAGLTVMGSSGQVGAGSTIRLRGNVSLSGNTPLIYIDGVRIENGAVGGDGETGQAMTPLDAVNPANIARIEIVKGPAATTLYGTQASGGVIQIFTKRGAAGTPAWTFSMDQGINHMGHVGPVMDASGLNMNDCTQDPVDPSCPADGNWFRNGYLQEYNLSVRGGAGDVTYFASGTWGTTEGVVGPQEGTDYSLRANFTFSPTDALNIQFNNYYSKRSVQWIPDGNNAEGFLLNVMRGGEGYTPDNRDALVLEQEIFSDVDHFISGATIRWTPGSGISQRLTAGMDWIAGDYTQEKPWNYYSETTGHREVEQTHNRMFTLDYVGSWVAGADLNLFGIESVSSTFSWGGQLYTEDEWALNSFANEFAGPTEFLVGAGTDESTDEDRQRVTSGGIFLQEKIGFNDRLFLTGGIRWDGFSTFGEGFGFAAYPKVAASYVLSDYTFWPDWWESMKLRAAYGESGNPPDVFSAVRTYEADGADENQPAVLVSNLGNPNLGPEITSEVEVGFDASMLNNRIGLSFSYYDQKTDGGLLCVVPPPSAGVNECRTQNIADYTNHGVETSLTLTPVSGDNVRWNLGLRYSSSISEVKDVGPYENVYIGWRNYAWPGKPLPVFCQDVVTNPNAMGVEPIMKEDHCIGQTFPPRTYGVSTTLTLFDRLIVDMLGEAQTGHVMSAGIAYQNTRRGVWPPCEDIQAQLDSNPDSDPFRGLTAGQVAKCGPNYTTYGMWTLPADFFKLRSVALTYRVPEDWLPGAARAMTIGLRANNLLTITDFPGLDPEASQDGGYDVLYRQSYYNLPPTQRYVLNVTVNF